MRRRADGSDVMDDSLPCILKFMIFVVDVGLAKLSPFAPWGLQGERSIWWGGARRSQQRGVLSGAG
jgi:hypothetical protein